MAGQPVGVAGVRAVSLASIWRLVYFVACSFNGLGPAVDPTPAVVALWFNSQLVQPVFVGSTVLLFVG